MTGIEFFEEMGRLHTQKEWLELLHLLGCEHPLVPGEREVWLELAEELRKLGQGEPPVRLDHTGLHVIKKTDEDK